MDVTCDGHSVYGKPFEPRFGNDQYLRSFLSIYQALASQNQVQNCNIDYEDYKGGYCFWGYDLTPDQAADQGARWLSGRVLNSRPKGPGFEPHRRHCVVVLKQDTFILA